MKAKHPILYIFFLIILLIPSIFLVEGFAQLAFETIYPANSSTINSIVFLAVGTIAAFGLIAIYRKYIDKESFFDMGFSFKNRLFDLLLGIATGATLILLGFIFLTSIGYLDVTNIDFDPSAFFSGMLLMVLVAFHEEVIVRGYLLNSLMSVSHKHVALFLSSVLFGAMHLMNPNISFISFINIVLAGYLLGISYIHSKNLWFPIGLHFSWNFVQGSVLGFQVSGQEIQSVITQQISGSDLITGGEFGFEGSIIATIIMIFAIIILNWFFEKREALTQKVTIDFNDNQLVIKE